MRSVLWLVLFSFDLCMLQGSVYKRINPEQEIKSTRNDAFWLKVQVFLCSMFYIMMF